MGQYYERVRRLAALRSAWFVISENGKNSRSEETRAEIATFASQAETNLGRIARQLRTSKFRFLPSHGIPISKKNKPGKKRPIVSSPVANRIVQRAILDVLQAIPAIKERQDSGFNFGGVPSSGVPKAVASAYVAAREKAYYVRTDIRAFFDNIPRQLAVTQLLSHTSDPEFDALVTAATTTELDNIKELGRDGELFPLEEIGVAQGSCLSPLVCNILLHDFDVRMNGRGIVCLRYIDDFIIFASTRAVAFKALASAGQQLALLGLDVYDPRNAPDKAAHGETRLGFTFLGCEIRPDRVRPSRGCQLRLRNRIEDTFDRAILDSANPTRAILDHRSYADSVLRASNIVRGWGNTFAFCTDDRLMNDVDKVLGTQLDKFNRRYRAILRSKSKTDGRRLVGFFTLQDCNKKPDLRELIAGTRTLDKVFIRDDDGGLPT